MLNKLDKELYLAIRNSNVEKAEEIIEKKLENDKNNTDLWISLAVTELCVPLVDYVKSIECIKRIFDMDKNNITAIILECCINYFHLGGIDKKVFNKLKLININNKEILSVIKYIMSWYYESKNVNKEKKLLKESIDLCNNYVMNYERLGRIYIIEGDIDKGKELIKKAIDNIQLIYKDDFIYDFTDINEYMDENVKKTHLTLVNKESIENLLN